MKQSTLLTVVLFGLAVLGMQCPAAAQFQTERALATVLSQGSSAPPEFADIFAERDSLILSSVPGPGNSRATGWIINNRSSGQLYAMTRHPVISDDVISSALLSLRFSDFGDTSYVISGAFAGSGGVGASIAGVLETESRLPGEETLSFNNVQFSFVVGPEAENEFHQESAGFALFSDATFEPSNPRGIQFRDGGGSILLIYSIREFDAPDFGLPGSSPSNPNSLLPTESGQNSATGVAIVGPASGQESPLYFGGVEVPLDSAPPPPGPLTLTALSSAETSDPAIDVLGYQFTSDENAFTSFSLASGLTSGNGVFEILADGQVFSYQAGDTADLTAVSPAGVSEFSLLGVDGVALDPENLAPFVAGLQFAEEGIAEISVTPVLAVPEASCLSLLGVLLAGALLLRSSRAVPSATDSCRGALAITALCLMISSEQAAAITIRDDTPDSAYTDAAAAHQSAVWLTDPGGLCSGVLIAPDWVLTAAHCVDDVTSADLPFVRVGNGATINSGTFAFGVSDVELHPSWDSTVNLPSVNGMGNYDDAVDFALLQIPSPSSVTPSSLSVQNSSVTGKQVDIVGYGRTGTGLTGDTGTSGSKRAAKNIIDQRGPDMNSSYSANLIVADFDAPAGGAITREGMIAPGDSGGPWIVGGRVAGISTLVNRNSAYGSQGAAGVLAPHLGWIVDTIGGTTWNTRTRTAFQHAPAWTDGRVPTSGSDVQFSTPSVAGLPTPEVTLNSSAAIDLLHVEFGPHEFFGGSHTLNATRGFVDNSGQLAWHSGTLFTEATLYAGFEAGGAIEQHGGHIDGSGIVIGRHIGSNGVFRMTGGTANVNVGLHVGVEGAGMLEQTGGSITVHSEFAVARAAGDTDTFISGEARLSSGSTTVLGSTYIGRAGDALLTVDGGEIITDGGHFRIAEQVTSFSRVNVADGLVEVRNNRDLYIGPNGDGGISQSGGSISVSGETQLGLAAGSNGSYFLSGDGKFEANSLVVGAGGSGMLSVQGGEATINGTLTIARDIGSSGAVIVDGGRLEAERVDLLTQGLFRFDFLSGELSFNHFEGNLHNVGSGIVSIEGEPVDDETLAAGDSEVHGQYFQGAQASLRVILQNDPVSLGGQLSIVGGIAATSLELDGTLIIEASPLADLSLLDVGDSFSVAASAFPITGDFARIEGPDLGPSLAWTTEYDSANEEVLLVVTSALTGDYNRDDLVDAADYDLWKSGYGDSSGNLMADGNGDGIVNAADYTVWRDNLGLPAVTPVNIGPDIATAVPEPSTAILLLGVLSTCLIRLKSAEAANTK